MEVKPIETIYNGYRFRSRLEARWAVFFDAAGIKYQYEPEGFTNEEGEQYLPDFFLPDLNTYVEVKGERKGAWEEIKKAQHMITWGGPIRRILILSEIPTNYDGGMWHFPCFYWEGASDQVWVGWWFFSDSDENVSGHISSADYYPPWSMGWDDGNYRSFKRELSFKALSDTILREEKNMKRLVGIPYLCEREILEMNLDFNQKTYGAFEKARQARFEHGETPNVEK